MNTRTLFLARLAGLFFVIVSLAMLVRAEAMLASITALAHNVPALLLVGFVGLAGGLAMVLGHNIWSGGALPVAVTLIGWWLLIRSALVLFLPASAILALFEVFRVSRIYYLSSAVTLLIGIDLIYASVGYVRLERGGG
jgi:hypothetical protein